jgi:hypothetical protein
MLHFAQNLEDNLHQFLLLEAIKEVSPFNLLIFPVLLQNSFHLGCNSYEVKTLITYFTLFFQEVNLYYPYYHKLFDSLPCFQCPWFSLYIIFPFLRNLQCIIDVISES